MLTEDDLDKDKLNGKSKNENLESCFSIQVAQLFGECLRLDRQEPSNQAIHFGIRRLSIRTGWTHTL